MRAALPDTRTALSEVASATRPWRRVSAVKVWPALALGLATGLARLLWVRPTPINWDAVQFALALDRFDLHDHQPHPPGYILYVGLGRLVNLLASNPSVALALLSVAFSVVGVALAYYLALLVFDDRTIALSAGLLVAASPLGLYYGSVALTYMPEMALSLAVACLAWKAHTQKTLPAAVLLGALLGISGGVRQTSMIVLLPLCIWALWGARRSRWAGFAVAAGAVCLAWFLPLLALSGGLAPYLAESAALADVVSKNTSLPRAGLEGLLYNLEFETLGLGLGLGFAGVLLGLWALRAVRFSLAVDVRRFIAFWALPPLILYAVTHVGQYGYMLVAVPPLLVLAAVCARVLGERFAPGTLKARWGVAMCAAAALASIGYFLAAQGPTTAANILDNDAHWDSLRSALRAYAPGSTVLVMGKEWEGPFRLAGYLLPEYRSYAAGTGKGGSYGWLYSAQGGQSTYSLPRPQAAPFLALPPGVDTVISLDDETAQRLMGAHSLQKVTLPAGSPFYVLRSPGVSVSGLKVTANGIEPVFGDAGQP